MSISLTSLFATLSSIFHSRAALQLENLALRHQIGVLQRSVIFSYFPGRSSKTTDSDDRRQGSVKLMTAASITLGTNSFLGTVMGPKHQFCRRMQLVWRRKDNRIIVERPEHMG
jgi:hypothetical protein